jgi:hypothetical protein
MHHVTQVLETHPQATVTEELARCVQACVVCALTCTSCADACLAEEDVHQLVRCIRLNLDCADVCVPRRMDGCTPDTRQLAGRVGVGINVTATNAARVLHGRRPAIGSRSPHPQRGRMVLTHGRLVDVSRKTTCSHRRTSRGPCAGTHLS